MKIPPFICFSLPPSPPPMKEKLPLLGMKLQKEPITLCKGTPTRWRNYHSLKLKLTIRFWRLIQVLIPCFCLPPITSVSDANSSPLIISLHISVTFCCLARFLSYLPTCNLSFRITWSNGNWVLQIIQNCIRFWKYIKKISV